MQKTSKRKLITPLALGSLRFLTFCLQGDSDELRLHIAHVILHTEECVRMRTRYFNIKLFSWLKYITLRKHTKRGFQFTFANFAVRWFLGFVQMRLNRQAKWTRSNKPAIRRQRKTSAPPTRKNSEGNQK